MSGSSEQKTRLFFQKFCPALCEIQSQLLNDRQLSLVTGCLAVTGSEGLQPLMEAVDLLPGRDKMGYR